MGGKKQAALRNLKKAEKDLRSRGKGKGYGSLARKNATVVLAQGALAVPKRNFGTNKSRGGGGKSIHALMKCLDARIPRTLGLPRAVGPYTVIRTTRLIKSDANFLLFAPFFDEGISKWYNWCGVTDVNSSLGVGEAGNTAAIAMPMDGLEAACEVVPAALTVQVMNPASLQTADGIFAMTRVNQQLMLGSSPATLTYNEMIARVISFYSPRLLTGGKLALRGVKCNAYPLDMTEYADFAPIAKYDTTFGWTNAIRPAALSPIVFVQDNVTPRFMEFMVTIEWRVRFDPGNPATASHVHHDTLPDQVWNGVVKTMSAAGHGVEELAEDAAAVGAMGKVAGLI